MNLILILTFILVNQSICSYIASDSTSQWVSIENSSAYKWCRYSTYYAMGYYCSTSDQATPFGDDPNYKCSSDTSSLPQNSKYLLWPVSTSDWNMKK